MDQFDALVGGAPTDQQTQMALAAALRRQNILGQLGQATGDRVLGPAGEGLSSEAMKGAQNIGSERARQAAMAQSLQFHQDDQADQAASLAEKTREANQSDQRSRELAAQTHALQQTLLSQRGDQEIALEKQKAADKAEAAQHGGKPIPDGEFQKLSAFKDAAESVDQSLANFKPEYAGAGKVIGRNQTNWMVANTPGLAGATGLVSDDDKNAANWWQGYGRGFTLDEMHNKFGARITPAEMARFEQYHVNPNMDAATIQKNLTQIGTQARGKLNERLAALDAAGYNKDQINEIRGSSGSPGMTATQPTGAASDQYIKAALAAKSGGAAAPSSPGIAAPSGSMFPQALGPLAPQQPRLAPGLGNMFQNMPGQQ